MQIPPYMVARAAAVIGSVIFFYLLSKQTSEYNKKVVEKYISFFSVVFIWMFFMKFVTNFPLLLERPLALLAYPSGTTEFYFAVMAGSIYYVLEIKRGKMEDGMIHIDLFRIFSGSMFIFYFFITVVYNAAPIYELCLWLVLYIGSWVVRRHELYALIGGLLVAFGVTLLSDVSDFMGIRIDASFYLVVVLIILVIHQWKRRM